MATYYRTIAYLMRAFMIIALLFSILIPISWWRTGEQFPDKWWAFYLVAIPAVAIIWLASAAILQMASRSK